MSDAATSPVSDEPALSSGTSLYGVLSRRVFTWMLLITSVIGMVAAFDLTLERFNQLKSDAEQAKTGGAGTYVANCDLNPLLNCSSVMKTPEAEIFGFPNSLLGMVTFAVMITFAVGMLAGARYRPWFWWGLILGQLGGMVMVHFLVYTSLFELNVVCPWCAVTWVATIPQFVLTLAHATTTDALGFSEERQRSFARIFALWPAIVIGWLGLIAAGVISKFM